MKRGLLAAALLGVAAAAAWWFLAAKETEDVMVVNVNDLETETEGWNEFCVGYHTVMVPPGLNLHWGPATRIDWNTPSVNWYFGGSARDYIETHEKFGGAVFETRESDWDIVVARERLTDTLISDTELVMYGARRFEDAIVMFVRFLSSERVGDGSDPQYRRLFKKLGIDYETPENRGSGFCFDGLVLTGAMPERLVDVWVDFTGDGRHGFGMHLSQRMQKPSGDSRPIAPSATAEDFPFIAVKEALLKFNGYDGVLTKISGTEDQADRHSLKALVEGPYGDLANPVIALDTIDDVGPMDVFDAQREFLAVLKNIRAN